MIDLVVFNIYGPDGMPGTVVGRYRTEQAAQRAKQRCERNRNSRIQGGDVNSKGERYSLEPHGEYQAVCETQSYGHYTEFARCGHKHRSMSAAQTCANRMEREEDSIAEEQGLLEQGTRFVVRAT